MSQSLGAASQRKASAATPTTEGAFTGPAHHALGGVVLARLVLPLATTLRRLAALDDRDRHAVSQVDWSILSLVGDAGSIGFKTLSELIALDPGQLSRGVTALQARGLVARKTLNVFPREVRLSLTPLGKAVFASLHEDSLRRNEALLDGLAAEDLQRLAEILRDIQGRATKMLYDRKSSKQER